MPYMDMVRMVIKAFKEKSGLPYYAPEKWKGYEFNCYAYALDLCMNFDGYEVAPGFLTREIDFGDDEYAAQVTSEGILDLIKEDLDVLGMKIEKSAVYEETNANQYKIGIYVQEDIDFHFVRQDANARWSEKSGWGGFIQLISSLGERDDYKFLGVFKITRKG